MAEVRILANNGSERPKISLWLGCTTRFYFEDTAKSIKSIFKKMDIDYEILDENANKYSCCASTLWGIGLEEYAEENRSKLKQTLFNGTGNNAQLVSPCPGCTQIFNNKYNINPKPIHITRFLYDNLEELKFENTNPLQLSYHDSCHLARGLGIIEEPRGILGKIPNLTLKELTYHGEKTLCCGSGGGLRAYNKNIADSMSSLIVKETEALGSSTIVTACPFCERSFNEGRDFGGVKIGVRNLLSMVDEYMI